MQLQDLPLWKRELALANAGLLTPVQPSKCIVWEDPEELDDSTAAITTPSPQWLSMAQMGGVLPPVEAYHDAKLEIELSDGKTYNRVGYLEASDLRKEAQQNGLHVTNEKVVEYPVHEAPVIGIMSEDEAIEYIVQKDVPHRVWSEANQGNRPRYLISSREALPSSRLSRNAWQMTLSADEPVEVNMDKAIRLFKQKVANEYIAEKNRLEQQQDVAVLLSEPVTEKLRQLQELDLNKISEQADKAKTEKDLEALYPKVLDNV